MAVEFKGGMKLGENSTFFTLEAAQFGLHTVLTILSRVQEITRKTLLCRKG
jgi:hypothetical protein